MRDENIYASLNFRMVKSSVWMSGLVGKLSLSKKAGSAAVIYRMSVILESV